MAEDKRPVRRQKNVTGKGTVQKHGQGLGTGPVGSQGGYEGRPHGSERPVSQGSVRPGETNQVRPGGVPAGNGGSGGVRAGGGLSKGTLLIVVIAVIAFFIFGGKGLFGGSGASDGGNDTAPQSHDTTPNSGSVLSSFLSGFSNSSVSSSGWSRQTNNGTLRDTTAAGIRDRYTDIRGNGKDEVTIMVYMCGTDLESKNGMASNDLAEMANATYSDNVNLLVYTGGCSNWKTEGIANTTNQIFLMKQGSMEVLDRNVGNRSMTDPGTLSNFIKYAAKNFPANRNILIFWDHGGGSLSGYGYDERFKSSGSMSLSGINKALTDGGVKFDFVGFDACLMATAENALMLSNHADYMIASEETEPGIGWFYTNWLTALSKNTSMKTLDIGKIIVDDFTDTCAQRLNSAKTTLSVVDLAELASTLPKDLSSFATSTTQLIDSDSYSTVSDARSGTREFSTNKIDQVDLVDLATRMGTKEGDALANAVLGAVKYSRVSSQMTNSYGLSIYFPYRSKASNVDAAIRTYDAIGMDDNYAECIRSFASMNVAGQVATGGTTSPFGSLTGSIFSSGTGSSASSAADLSSLLSSFLSGSSGIDIAGLIGGRSFLADLDPDKAAAYISQNSLSASDFAFRTNAKGQKVIELDDAKWNLVQDIELNVFVDDGSGYIDLGLDDYFDYTDEGALLGEYDGSWLGINGQVVAYYHMNTVGDQKNYTITGRVPVRYNGVPANLILAFTDKDPNGSVIGLMFDYSEEETSTVAKMIAADEFAQGDTFEFLCDYYSYSNEYLDSYVLGEKIVYDGKLAISDLDISEEKTNAVYRITDQYNQHFWTSVMD